MALATGAPVKALTWHGKMDVRIDNVPDPRIEQPGTPWLRLSCYHANHPLLRVRALDPLPRDDLEDAGGRRRIVAEGCSAARLRFSISIKSMTFSGCGGDSDRVAGF
jgi:hypothetical protein